METALQQFPASFYEFARIDLVIDDQYVNND